MPSPVRLSRRTTVAGLAAVALTPLMATAAARGIDEPQQNSPLIGSATGARIHLMTYNVRLDLESPRRSPDSWPRRRPALTALLKQEQPTLLGVQEAEFHQFPAIRAALPHHEMVGYGRSGGSVDEHNAIFFDTRRFELVKWDQFWLSDTPDVVGSATWGNTITRMVVWARLRDRTTGREFIHVNTHFDHESPEARAKSAEVVARLRRTFGTMPVLLTGDFNAKAGGGVHDTLTSTYLDAWQSAKRRLTPAYGTFPNYDEPETGTKRIDWLLTTSRVRVHEVGVNITRPDGVWPSDHLPVQALVELA